MSSSRFAVAVHVLALQALSPEVPLTSAYLAGSVSTNPVVVRRLLALLAGAGLVTTTPGPHGGARLARPAARITLADVLAAVEEDGLLTLHKSPPNPRCPVGRNIEGVLSGLFVEAERALSKTLERTTIDDVAKAIGKCLKANPPKS